MIERLWKVRFKLDENEALKTKDGGFAVVCNNKLMGILNKEYEYDVWATSRTEALQKGMKDGGNFTAGIVAVSVGENHSNSRSKS